jgi:glycosyltransferase involved in cell wall biosynthesis
MEYHTLIEWKQIETFRVRLMKMKIGIEVQRLFRKQKFGIEVAALQMIKQLQANFKQCEFVVYAKPDEDDKCLETSTNLSIKKVAGKLFFDFEHVTLPLAAKADKVDLLHCTGNTRPYFSPVPVVQTLHDVIFMDPISKSDTLYQRFGNRYRRLVVPMVTPKSQAVITVSEYEKKRILNKIAMDERNIRVIYNGIDEDRFKVNQEPTTLENVKMKYSLPSRYILFLGNTASRKNALRVIEAYCMYAQNTLDPIHIVTPGLPEKFIVNRLTELNQRDKFKYFVTPGYIDDNDLASIYSLCTFFLYPSLSEGFGMPLVEAMACGAPVITSNTTCLPEVSGNAAVLVNPEDAAEIARAIAMMSEDESLRLLKIAQGILNAKRFSWSKTAERVFKVYEDVLFTKNSSTLQPLVPMAFQM